MAKSHGTPRPGRASNPIPLAAAAAGALTAILLVLRGAWWVEYGASVGWASFNSDGIEISTGSKLFIIVIVALPAAALGMVLGVLVGLMAEILPPRPPPDPASRRLVAQLVATWVVACLPLLFVATDTSTSYAGEVPSWSLIAGGTGSLIWLLAWALRRRPRL